MMNINCALNCFFQEDGKCALTHIISASSSPHPECIYYRSQKKGLIDTSNTVAHDVKM
ncbi:MAG: hydroxymyristoyl-ACP dehydratase [Anaerosolibacter sp.]|jgi:hypothetical protein|nr:hydroxymyristoyl-ACP dehydratase [Anaerosolibacter sp.]